MSMYGIKGSLKIDIGSSKLYLVTNNLNATPKTFMVDTSDQNPNKIDIGEFATWVTNKVGDPKGGDLSKDFTAEVTINQGLISSDGRLLLDLDAKYSGDLGSNIKNLGTIKVGAIVERLPLTLAPASGAATAKAGAKLTISAPASSGIDFSTTTKVSFNNVVQTNGATAATKNKNFEFTIPATLAAGSYPLAIVVESDGYTFSVATSYTIKAA